MSDQSERKRSSTLIELKDESCSSPDSKKHKGAFSESTNTPENNGNNGTVNSNGLHAMTGVCLHYNNIHLFII